MMEKWNSRKFVGYALALGALLGLVYLKAPPEAFTPMGLIAMAYLGGQAAVDAVRK